MPGAFRKNWILLITSMIPCGPRVIFSLGSGHHWPFWKQCSYALLKAFQGPSSSQAVMLNSEETLSPSFPTGMELCLVRTIAICFRRPSASFAWSRGVPEPTREGMVRVGDYMLPRCAGNLFAIVLSDDNSAITFIFEHMCLRFSMNYDFLL